MSLTNTEQLALQNKYSNRKQLLKELSDTSRQKEKLVSTRDLIQKQFDLQTLNDTNAVKPENYKLLKPTWQFELDPEHMARHREITIIGHQIKALEFEAALQKHQENIDTVTKQVFDLTAQLDKVEREISELEKKKGE